MITPRNMVFTVVFMVLMGYALHAELRPVDRWVFGVGVFVIGACELARGRGVAKR